MRLKVRYRVVEEGCDKSEAKTKTTEIFLSGALLPEDITEMLIKRNPDCESIEIEEVEEVEDGARPEKKSKPKKTKKKESKGDDDDEGDDVVTLSMEFSITPDSCRAKIVGNGEVLVDNDFDFAGEQDKEEIGGMLIAAMTEMLEELGEEEED